VDPTGGESVNIAIVHPKTVFPGKNLPHEVASKNKSADSLPFSCMHPTLSYHDLEYFEELQRKLHVALWQ
jgi:hypothetical protein